MGRKMAEGKWAVTVLVLGQLAKLGCGRWGKWEEGGGNKGESDRGGPGDKREGI